MALLSGARLGPYEILAPLGKGGMGEVYRARDTKLGREVALKILPEEFAFDPERVARLEREAKVLASLNHPHIAALYGMEQSGGRHFLLMELVEGETLAERLAGVAGSTGPGLRTDVGGVLSAPPRHGLPVAEVLSIARQICEALEAAHEKNVIHRDLKPANVKITPDGNVKVLDFGLAKALETAPANAQLTNSPTLSLAATYAGVILGTAAYMSPEQAKGLAAAQRSDIFSFGSVLYEMFTGHRPFDGETVSEGRASVIKSDPDFALLPDTLDPRLRALLRRCLEKNPRTRWYAIGDVRVEMESILANAGTAPKPQPAPPMPLWKRVVPAVLLTLAVAAIAGAALWKIRPTPPLTVTRFSLTLGEGQQFSNITRDSLAISPDGTQLVYSANQGLYLRSMSQLDARVVPGTEIRFGVNSPVFSPDGQSIAFHSGTDHTLKRIAVSGGSAVTICQADDVFGMSWGTDGIVFGQGSKGIMRVSPNGGKPELLVSVKGDELAHGPQMLPGGEAVLFTLAKGIGSDRWDKAQIVVYSLKSGERKILVEGGSDARYLPTNHLVYARGGVLFAVPFDPRRIEVIGGPVPIVEGVRRSTGNFTGAAQVSVSDTGAAIYIPGPVTASAGLLDLGLIDRNGAVEPLKLAPASYDAVRLSPDGKQIAFGTDDGKEAIVWVYDLSGPNSMRRLSFGGRNRFPIWSADGQRVAFQSDRDGDLAIFWQRADGTGTAERLTKPEQKTSHIPESWSPKGDTLLFRVTKDSGLSLWTFSPADKKTTPFGGVQSSGPTDAVFSPDGRWVAYASVDTGRSTVYVQPFPATGAKYQISRDGGRHPLWSRDGKELRYVIPGGGQYAVATVSTQPAFTFSNPAPAPRPFQDSLNDTIRTFDITPDGKFLGGIAAGQTQSGAAAAPQIQVVLNWFEELKQRVPVK